MYLEYSFSFFFFLICLIIGLILYVISYYLILKDFDQEKGSAYECGFEPFGDARSVFDVKFYLVGILFVIFDVEIIFLFPWCLVLGVIGFHGFVVMCLFIFLLLLGYVYEWLQGVLDWV